MPNDIIKFKDMYELQDILGKGAFSTVYRCVDIATQKEYAAKIIKKDVLSKRNLMKLELEARICRKLNHPNIVKLLRVISEMKYHYFVFDLVTGGELFDDLVTQGDNYSEKLAGKCMHQMLETIKYCHSMGVIHRDLKPENILLESKENKIIKLADFGLAVEVNDNENKWFGMAGTPHYMAPEVLEMKPYGKPVDIWACGVILYIMLAGYQPFYHKDERKLNMLIKTGDYELTSASWKNISEEGKDMISKLLCIVPAKRLTAAAALDHIWFYKVKECSFHSEENFQQLKKFNARRKFKAAGHLGMIFGKIMTVRRRQLEASSYQAASTSSTSSSRSNVSTSRKTARRN